MLNGVYQLNSEVEQRRRQRGCMLRGMGVYGIRLPEGMVRCVKCQLTLDTIPIVGVGWGSDREFPAQGPEKAV